MIVPPGSCLMEDPITDEKWGLCFNGWINPGPGAATQDALKKQDAV